MLADRAPLLGSVDNRICYKLVMNLLTRLTHKSYFLLLAISIVAGLIIAGCSQEEPVPYGQVRVKNDFHGDEYTTVVVSAAGRSYTMEPGDRVLLPQGVTTISFKYKQKNYTRYYTVECPRDLGAGINMKLLEVHVNKLDGGCRTVSAEKG